MLDPTRTVAVICGASSWPYLDRWDSAPAFRNTAQAFRSYLEGERIGLPAEQMLWLFDAEGLQHHLDTISAFLYSHFGPDSQGLGWTVLFFYSGHGSFPGSNQEYCLALRDSRPPYEEETSLRAVTLGRLLRYVAAHSSRIVMLDSCFAAEAVSSLQAPLDEAVGRQVQKMLVPEAGQSPGSIAVLCAADRDSPAQLESPGSWTTFGKSIILSLTEGDPGVNGPFTLRTLSESVAWRQKLNGHPIPEVHVPSQRNGDLAGEPLFPNPAATHTRLPASPTPPPQSTGTVETRSNSTVRQAVLGILEAHPDDIVRTGTRLHTRLTDAARKLCQVPAEERIIGISAGPVSMIELRWKKLLVFTDWGVHQSDGLSCPYEQLRSLKFELASMRNYGPRGYRSTVYACTTTVDGSTYHLNRYTSSHRRASGVRALLISVTAAAG